MKRPTAMFLLPALGLLAACGGGPKREVFLSRAEERCRNMLTVFPREQLAPGATALESADLNRRRADAFRRSHRELRSLEAPKELRAEFQQYLAKTERQGDNRLEYAQAIPTGDERQLRYLDEEFRALNETKNELRRRLGFRTC
jgi:hypothetical protein